MKLKRLYNHDAPKKEWQTVKEPCATCQGRGVIVNAAGDGIAPCPDCMDGVRTRKIPPVVGVEVLHAGKLQKFSTKIVARGQKEGWLQIDGGELKINGRNKALTYKINRTPGKHEIDAAPGHETIHYYDCELSAEEEQANG